MSEKAKPNAGAAKPKLNDRSPYPAGWDRSRVQALIDHYESQSDEDAIAEAEGAYASIKTTMMQIPTELVPKVAALLAKQAS